MSDSFEPLLLSPPSVEPNSPETQHLWSEVTRADSDGTRLWSPGSVQPNPPDTLLWSPQSTPAISLNTQLWPVPPAEMPAKQLRNLRLDPMFPRDESASPDSFRLDPEGATKWEAANGWDLRPAIRLRSQWSLNHIRNFSRPMHWGNSCPPLGQVEANKSNSWSSSNRSAAYRIYDSESSEAGSRSDSASSDASELSDSDMYNLPSIARRHALPSTWQSLPQLSEQRWSSQAKLPGTMTRTSVDLPGLRSQVSMDGTKTSFSSSFRQELQATRPQPTTSSGSIEDPSNTIFVKIRRSVVLNRGRQSMEQINRDPYSKSTVIMASRPSLSALDAKGTSIWLARRHAASEQPPKTGAKLKSEEIKRTLYSELAERPRKESAELNLKISPALHYHTLKPKPEKNVKLKKKMINPNLRRNISRLFLQEDTKLEKAEIRPTLRLETSKLLPRDDGRLKKSESNPDLLQETTTLSPRAVAKLKNKDVNPTSSGTPTSEPSLRKSPTVKRLGIDSALSDYITELSPREIAHENAKLNKKDNDSTSYHSPITELSPRQSATLRKMDIDPSLYHHITELAPKEIAKLKKNGFIPTLCPPAPEMSTNGGVKLKRPEINPTLYLEWKTPRQKKSNWKTVRCL